jgi:hypothetical protein
VVKKKRKKFFTFWPCGDIWQSFFPIDCLLERFCPLQLSVMGETKVCHQYVVWRKYPSDVRYCMNLLHGTLQVMVDNGKSFFWDCSCWSEKCSRMSI